MQVSDDPELLKLMMNDAGNAPRLYKTTNYWAVYEKRFLIELQKLGLHNFRRRKKSVFSSFGATDLFYSLGQIDLLKSRMFNNRITKKIPLWSGFLDCLNTFLNKIFPISSRYTIEEFEQLFCYYAHMYGEKIGAKSVDDFEASLIGNPEHIVEMNSKVYTMSILGYYLKYAYCCNYINFDNIKIMVELGCGSGKQIEVLKKLHPDICFLLFDIPPQLYVSEQYLSSVFPDDVVSYRDTKMMDSIPRIRKGKIFIFGNWKFPILENVTIDLSWSSASFQEMEPHIVANYLKYINAQSNAVFLCQLMGGKRPTSKKGNHGVLKRTKLEDYKNGLTNFKLRNMSPVLWPISKQWIYSDSFWERI